MATPAHREKARKLQGFAIKAGFILAILLAWHLVTTEGLVSPLFLPQPGETFRTFIDIIASGEAFDDLSTTLFELSIAFPLAAMLGTIIGYLVSTHVYSIRVFEPIFAGLYAIPVIIFYPLNVLFFGLGVESKIVHGALFGFFPIVLNTIQGFARVDPVLVKLAHSLGASRLQMVTRILFPAALPAMLTGYRMGFILSFLAIIGAETIASFAGLGHRIVWYAEALNMPMMFAYILFVVLVAALMNMLVSAVESWMPMEGK
jgi:ABC-type nitrate/sulfonate/bicarbonate transport system permease component